MTAAPAINPISVAFDRKSIRNPNLFQFHSNQETISSSSGKKKKKIPFLISHHEKGIVEKDSFKIVIKKKKKVAFSECLILIMCNNKFLP